MKNITRMFNSMNTAFVLLSKVKYFLRHVNIIADSYHLKYFYGYGNYTASSAITSDTE